MQNKRLILFAASICLFVSCSARGCSGRMGSGPFAEEQIAEAGIETETESGTPDKCEHPESSPVEQKLDSMGLVNIARLDPSIRVEIVYSTSDNFTGKILYDDLSQAYLLPEAAQKLITAQKKLKEEYPSYSLIVYDAARPMSVQRKMREAAVKTGKQYYVANPANGGGLHNYGAAVDVSIVDGNRGPLPMGTGYDFLGPESNTDRERELLSSGKISKEELANRLLLRKVMKEAGFSTVTSEWWHFNHCSRPEAIKKYRLIDF